MVDNQLFEKTAANPNDKSVPPAECIIAGWGEGIGEGLGDRFAMEPGEKLQNAEVFLVDSKTCEEHIDRIKIIEGHTHSTEINAETEICAANPNTSIGPGDSGGPLVCFTRRNAQDCFLYFTNYKKFQV